MASSDSDGGLSGTQDCWVVESGAPGVVVGQSTDWVGCCSEAEGEEGEGVGSYLCHRCSVAGYYYHPPRKLSLKKKQATYEIGECSNICLLTLFLS